MTTNQSNHQNLDWEISLQKLYRRRETNQPLREGDPRRFLAAAADLTARKEERQANALRPEANSPNTIVNCWDTLLPAAFLEHEITAGDPETDRPEVLLGKILWEILQQFGSDDAYIFLTLITKAGETDHPWQTPIQLNAEEIPILLGWEKPRPNEKPIDRFSHILKLVDRVIQRTLTITITDISAPAVANHTVTQHNSPFWTLNGCAYISRLGRLSTSASDPAVYRSGFVKDIQFTLTPGHWIQIFLDRNPHSLNQLIEFSHSAKGILRINPTRKKLAARLALFLTAIEPLHPSASYRVRDLLSEVESDKNLQNYYKTDETQTRLFVRWNNALRALKNLEWSIEFDDETYPNALRPIWSSEEEEDSPLPGRFNNWFSTWLDGRLILRSTPLEPRLENIRMGDRRLGSIITRPKRERISAPTGPAPITGKTLNVALTLKGWSKAQLSYQLHMDRSMITHWIKGSRPISDDQRKRLWKILGKELLAAQKVRY
jgi:hypothetical protein